MDLKFYLNKEEDCDFNENEFPIALNDYRSIIDIFIFLIHTPGVKNIKDDYWRYFTEIFAIKFIWSADTLANMINGSKLNSEILNFSTKIIDIPSIYTLLRSQIENYSTFQYLYIRPKSKQIQEFRCLIYEISGLESRQQFEADLPETNKIKLLEKEKIRELLIRLKNNSIFLSLEANEQKKILNDKKARLFGWRKIIEESDLIDNIYKTSWMSFSNYAHSEYAALTQIKDFIQNFDEMISARNLSLNLALILVCIFIIDFIDLYPPYRERYNSISEEDKNVIEYFNGTGRKSIFNKSE